MLRMWIVLLICGLLVACDRDQPEQESVIEPEVSEPATDAPPETATEPMPEQEAHAQPESGPDERLQAILDAQPDEVQARYRYRNPAETLQFFGIEPGMTVVEALPGGGWYTRILLPYLGEDGKLIGADYAMDMWPRFPFGTEEFIEGRKTWTTDWPARAQEWGGEDGAEIDAFVFGSMPDEFEGQADAVLFIRALHNMARYEDEGGYLTAAFEDAYRVLQPGGIVGIVQHEARNDRPDEWADGSKGYLKRSLIVEQMEQVGFELVAESDINANPQDQPGDEDVVWRLPPSLRDSGEDPELRAEMEAIGESNRMTLKFRKPE